MAIRIQVRLFCDGCGAQFITMAESDDQVSLRDIERLRAIAREQAGWDRRRPSINEPERDLCGPCDILIRNRARKAR